MKLAAVRFKLHSACKDCESGALLLCPPIPRLFRENILLMCCFVLQTASVSNIYYNVAFATECITNARWILPLSLRDYRRTAHFGLCAGQHKF